jgi:hypothetical protein
MRPSHIAQFDRAAGRRREPVTKESGSMNTFGFGRSLRRAALAATAGLSVASLAAAQEKEATQPDDRDINPAAERVVKQDAIAFYQVRAGETDYTPGRLRVFDLREGELRGVTKSGVLLVQNGKIVGRAETGVGGVAQIRGLRPGAYSVIAIGPNGMAAFGMDVLPPAGGVAVPAYRFDALMVPAADMAVAQTMLAPVAGPTPAVGPNPPAKAIPVPTEPPSPPLPATPASLKRRKAERQAEVVVSAPIDGAPDAAGGGAAAPGKGEPVVVRNGDRMVGQLVTVDPRTEQASPMGGSRLLFLRGGRLLGTIETNSDGYFGVTGLEDGVYSMVGIGPSGFIAIGVQVNTIAGPATAAIGGRSLAATYVSLLQGGNPTVNLRAVGASNDALPFAPGFAGPGPFGPGGMGGPGSLGPGGGGAFGGGGGGFGGGGGGFGGGGGLLGALLGAGLGAALGAAVANDDDNGNGNNQQPASPNGPPFNPTPGVPGPPFNPTPGVPGPPFTPPGQQ